MRLYFIQIVESCQSILSCFWKLMIFIKNSNPQRNLYSVINNIFYDIKIFFMTKNSEVQSMPQGVLILSLLFRL